MALGSDGTVIICTHSGHVFVRQRVKSGSGGLKFRRIPYIQRAIKVACNESGAFAAIVVNADPTPITLVGRTLEEDLALLLPHYQRFEHQMTAKDFARPSGRFEDDEDEDEGVNSVHRDLQVAGRLCAVLERWRDDAADNLFAWSRPLLGSDLHVIVGDVQIPAHMTILSLRIPKLAKATRSRVKVDIAVGTIILDVCHPLVALLLLEYIYTDDVPALWDARVARALQAKHAGLALPFAGIKADLKSLADAFELKPLSKVLESAGKVVMPQRTLPADLRAFFDSTYSGSRDACDVLIKLADKDVACASVLLRARCPFFEAMFADNDWTTGRIEGGKLEVDMSHLRWRPMRMVFRYIHEGLEDDLFDFLRASQSCCRTSD